ncbi:MAG: hypothetical protein DWQ06_01260 [Calditrichaeota bacterium]|nr:MAG: hypothetical protein DWQ06_01260 [Calditrichota bacterium]
MKFLIKIILTVILLIGLSFVVSAQTYVEMQLKIEGSSNGNFLAESTITSITGTYSSPIQTLVVGPSMPNTLGLNYFENIGVLTCNLSNFGSALIFSPFAFPSTFQFDIQIDDPTLLIPSQQISTGSFIIPQSTISGQALPVDMGTLNYDDLPLNFIPPVDPTPPNVITWTPQPSILGIPVQNLNGTNFLAPNGGVIGGMVSQNGGNMGGVESISIVSLSSKLLTSPNGNLVDVGMIWNIEGCSQPSYVITLNIPQASLENFVLTINNIGISHDNVLYSLPNGNLTVLNGNLDGSDPNGAQVQFIAQSCSPFYLQDADKDPLNNNSYVPLPSPQNLEIELLPNSNDIRLTWNTVTGAGSYQIYIGLNSNSFIPSFLVSGTNSFIHSNATLSNQKLYYFVTAED